MLSHYKLVQCCCCFKCYAYIGVFKQIGNFPRPWAIVNKCGPDLVFLSGFCVIGFVLYLLIEVLEQVLWEIVVFSYRLCSSPFFLFFCLGLVVGNAF
jgi:hypothetical protein